MYKERIAEILPELLNYPDEANIDANYYKIEAQKWIDYGFTDHIEIWDWLCNGYNDPAKIITLKEQGQMCWEVTDFTKNKILEKYGDKAVVDIKEDIDCIYLELLHVKVRNHGIGTQIMHEICDIADSLNKSIILIPTAELNSEYNRLVNFYNRFGFKWGLNKTMIRTN